MNPQPPTASGPEGACRQVRETLARLERSGPSDAPGLPPTSGSADVDGLRTHLDTCDACRGLLGARVRRLQAFRALRERSAPEGTFEGFYAQVRERVPFAPAGGGMSRAFLDAPRSLRLWRGAAVAAGVLLAATAGLAVTRGDSTTDPAAAVRPLHDPREGLLEAYDTRPDARAVPRVRNAGSRGHGSFFERGGVEVVPIGHGAGWK